MKEAGSSWGLGTSLQSVPVCVGGVCVCERVCRVVSPSLSHTHIVPLGPASQIALWVRCFFHQGWRWPKHTGRNSTTLRLRLTWQTPAGTPVQLFSVRVNASLLPSKRDFQFQSLQKQRDRTLRLSSPPPTPCADFTQSTFYFLLFFPQRRICRAAFRSICIDHGVLNRLEI